jgi:hypothetical protein
VVTGRTFSSRAGPAGAEAGRREAQGRARVAGAARREAQDRSVHSPGRGVRPTCLRSSHGTRGPPRRRGGVRTPTRGAGDAWQTVRTRATRKRR